MSEQISMRSKDRRTMYAVNKETYLAIRRAVIEELAREAEERYKAFWDSGFDVGNYGPLEQFEDDPFAAIPEDQYYSSHLGQSVAAWLRQHVKGGEFATFGEEEG